MTPPDAATRRRRGAPVVLGAVAVAFALGWFLGSSVLQTALVLIGLAVAVVEVRALQAERAADPEVQALPAEERARALRPDLNPATLINVALYGFVAAAAWGLFRLLFG